MARTVFIIMLACFFAACTDRRELVPETPGTPAARDPVSQKVVVSEEVIPSQAPAVNGQAPAACDSIHYLRFRLATDTGAPLAARAVVIMIPGYLGGAGSFSYFARALVALAGSANPVEVWALDRRSNCLEDQTGMQEAESLRDPQAAVDYYYNGASIGGVKFSGFYDQADTPYLSEFGLKLAMEDIYTILQKKIPNPADRKNTVFIAGHSIGAEVAAVFAAWDFDNDATTPEDAGFNNCAGLIGLEGRVSMWSSTPTRQKKYEQQLAQLRAAEQSKPFITPEAMALIELLGLYAAFEPGSESTVLRSISVTPATAALVKYFTTYGLEPSALKPALGDFHLSNEAMLGLFADDNFQPISIGRVSLGFLAGGPVVRRRTLLGGDRLFAPADSAAFYTWTNFDAIGTADDPDFTDTTGRVVLTTAESEVTDIQNYARVLFEDPLNFYEWYFPGRLSLDLGIVAAPFRAAYGINTLYLDTIASLPKKEFFAKDIPGYDHLDVLCAAADRTQRRQNEIIGPLLDFVLENSTGTVLIP